MASRWSSLWSLGVIPVVSSEWSRGVILVVQGSSMGYWGGGNLVVHEGHPRGPMGCPWGLWVYLSDPGGSSWWSWRVVLVVQGVIRVVQWVNRVFHGVQCWGGGNDIHNVYNPTYVECFR